MHKKSFFFFLGVQIFFFRIRPRKDFLVSDPKKKKKKKKKADISHNIIVFSDVTCMVGHDILHKEE